MTFYFISKFYTQMKRIIFQKACYVINDFKLSLNFYIIENIFCNNYKIKCKKR